MSGYIKYSDNGGKICLLKLKMKVCICTEMSLDFLVNPFMMTNTQKPK